MKFVKPDAAPAPDGGGGRFGASGIPSWKMEWIKNKMRAVLLKCGHVEDLHDNAITLINSFDGSEVDCVRCGRFVKVDKPLKRIVQAAPIPDQPLF